MIKMEIQKKNEDDSKLGASVFERNDLIDIRPDSIITTNGHPQIVYGRIDRNFKKITAILKAIKYDKNARISINSRVSKGSEKSKIENFLKTNKADRTREINFGFKSAQPLYGTASGACRLNSEAPEWYHEIMELGEYTLEKYQSIAPERLNQHQKIVHSAVGERWRIGATPFTQGIINDKNSLRYHYDRGNFNGVWSCMAYFVAGVKGGNLIIPSFGIRLLVENSTFVLFDGQGLIHGVTPIIKTRPSGYRYSLVYYSRKTMAGLGSYSEELKKTQDREFKKHLKNVETDKKRTF